MALLNARFYKADEDTHCWNVFLIFQKLQQKQLQHVIVIQSINK